MRVQEEDDEREMMKGLKIEHGLTEVRNPIGNHIPMSQNGHGIEIRLHVGKD